MSPRINTGSHMNAKPVTICLRKLVQVRCRLEAVKRAAFSHGRVGGHTCSTPSVRAHSATFELRHDSIQIERCGLLPRREISQTVCHVPHVRLDRDEHERMIE
jgi:hypothetical protein